MENNSDKGILWQLKNNKPKEFGEIPDNSGIAKGDALGYMKSLIALAPTSSAPYAFYCGRGFYLKLVRQRKNNSFVKRLKEKHKKKGVSARWYSNEAEKAYKEFYEKRDPLAYILNLLK
jgi:hypothetical protein